MIIKDKEIIEEGVKLFYTILTFKTACSGYFNFKNYGYEDDVIQDFLDFSEPQRMFLSTLWNDPKYSESYKKDPCVIIYNGHVEWSVIPKNKHHTLNEVQKEFDRLEIFKRAMLEFIVLKFKNITTDEIQNILDLTENQIIILLRVFDEIDEISGTLLSKLEHIYFNEV